MNIQNHSSGVAKAGLATGITGTALGVLNMAGSGVGLLNGLTRSNIGQNCCNEDHLVNRYEAAKDARIAELERDIALRDANVFTDQKILETYKYMDGRFRDIEKQLAVQEVQNQKTADSFQIVSERMDCCCKSLNARIDSEAHERRCADNAIVNYANATFYPKMVADVTTGSTTTAQTTYNPLPAETCNCGNSCC